MEDKLKEIKKYLDGINIAERYGEEYKAAYKIVSDIRRDIKLIIDKKPPEAVNPFEKKTVIVKAIRKKGGHSATDDLTGGDLI